MKDYTQKFKVLYEKLGGQKISYEKSGVRPSRDWKIMLVGTFVVICCLAFFAFDFYWKIEAGEVFMLDTGTVSREAEIDSLLLKKIVGEINDRAAFVQELKASGSIPTDPSI